MSDEITVRPIAPESNQVRKARAKILARLNAEDQLINENTLAKVKEVNRAQHHRYTSFREAAVIEQKPLSLFAQGIGVKRDPSPRVQAIEKRMREEFREQHEAYQGCLSPMTIKPLESDS